MIYFGPAGWTYRDWDGVFYPGKRGKAFDALAFTAQYFEVVEINSTFYHLPVPEVVNRWVERVSVNPRFKFTAKAWRKFTHDRDYNEDDLDLFCRTLEPLSVASKLAAVLLQFPWSFKNEDQQREYVARLTHRLRAYPLVLEVRHDSWNHPSTFEFLRSMNVGFCNIDQPLIGKSLRPTAIVTATDSYFRMHGRNYRNWFREEADVNERYDYLYSTEELAEARELITAIAERSRNTYVILNNHRNAQAATNALELKSMVTGKKVTVPKTLLNRYPELRPFARAGDLTLFPM
ncbi:MAG: DUF72 domain-containing protein [Acidobacteria bacterium]|nr:DUF72 domain-containing protein [Acidobacteriota bacterium]